MTSRSSILATLEDWEQNPRAVDRIQVAAVLTACGYEEQQAGDYRDVLIYYRPGWVRWTLLKSERYVPEALLQRIVVRLKESLEKEGPK